MCNESNFNTQQNRNCKSWKIKGYCEELKYKKIMTSKCSNTCGFCNVHNKTTTTTKPTKPKTKLKVTTEKLKLEKNKKCEDKSR